VPATFIALEQTPSASFQTLFYFDSLNVDAPLADTLLTDATGRIYGTTEGGFGNGTIYRFDPTLNTMEMLFTFNRSNGRSPYGGLLDGLDGFFYGTTFYGGVNDLGTVFRFDPRTNQLVTLVEFDFANGAAPSTTLVRGSDGNLYGTTLFGGTNGDGTLFQVDLSLV
jgi:uncharacterized repeat protein (TIGR03803 family)